LFAEYQSVGCVRFRVAILVIEDAEMARQNNYDGRFAALAKRFAQRPASTKTAT